MQVNVEPRNEYEQLGINDRKKEQVIVNFRLRTNSCWLYLIIKVNSARKFISDFDQKRLY